MSNIPQCDICLKRISVPFKAIVGGPFLEVCDECLKFGERVEITDIDKIMIHSPVNYVLYMWIESSKGE